MNKEKFIEFLKNPDLLKENDLSELEELVSESPYFQAARILEAKGNRALKTSAAGKKTASAAIYSTNRILLKEFLAGDKAVVSKQPIEKPAHVQKPESSIAASPAPEHKQDEVTPAAEVVKSSGSSLDLLIDSIYNDLEEMKRSRAKYIETTRKIEEEEAVEKAVKKATENAEVDKTPNVWKSYKGSDQPTKIKEEKPATPKKTSNSGTAKKATSTATKTGTTKKSTSSPSKTGSAKKTTASKKPATKTTGTKTSTKPKASSSSKASTTKKAVTKKAATKKTTARKSTGTTKAITNKAAGNTAAKKNSGRTSRSSKSTKTTKKDDKDSDNQHELVDQFIKANPSFKPSKDGKNAVDLSAESTTLPEDVASEYLAEIFVSQGKKEHAIKIYNSLMLRFPEKKAYFAGRIKKIK